MSRLAVLAVLASIRPGRSLVMKHCIKTTYLTANNKASADLLRLSEEGFYCEHTATASHNNLNDIKSKNNKSLFLLPPPPLLQLQPNTSCP